MSEKAKLDSFDWVSERATCSLLKVYEKLRLEVENDVKTRNSLRPNQIEYEFQLVTSNKSFAVILDAHRFHHSVTFLLVDKYIDVQKEDTLMFRATVHLNNEGDCVLIIGTEEHTLWQVRKKALEQLFFGFV